MSGTASEDGDEDAGGDEESLRTRFMNWPSQPGRGEEAFEGELLMSASNAQLYQGMCA